MVKRVEKMLRSTVMYLLKQVSELRSEVNEFGLKTESEILGANKVMEAKIVDLDDKLRLGMAKMQVLKLCVCL